MSASREEARAAASLAWRRGNAPEAERLAHELLASDPGDVEAGLLLGGMLLQRQEWARARSVLAELIEHHPDDARLLINLSVALRGLDRLTESIDVAERATRLEPGRVGSWNALGTALMAADRPREAERALSKGVELHPRATTLHHHLGQAMAAQGRTGQAMQVRSTLARSGSEKGREAAALAGRGELGPALNAYREAVQLHPSDTPSLVGMGCLLLRMGQRAEASDCLARACRIDPHDPVAGHFLRVARGELPRHATADYIRDVFDSYADQFDRHLVEALDYRVPAALVARLEARSENGPGMLLKAREKRIYRQLYLADIGQFVADTTQRWHTVVAADVFIYYGDVADLFVDLYGCIEPGGWFAFSVESAADKALEIDPVTGRYRHGRQGLTESLGVAGFEDIEFVDAAIRRDGERIVEGWLVTACRR